MTDVDLSTVNIEKVRGCCCRVLPLTLYECISTPEVLSRLTNKLNEIVDVTNALPDYIEQLIIEYLTGGPLGDLFGEILQKYFLTVKNPPNKVTPAVGDGTADDTAAFQECLNYASANDLVVIVPSGKYLVQPLTFGANASLVGFGKYSTELVLKGGSTSHMITGVVQNGSIKDLTINGNSGNQVNDLDGISVSANNAQFENLVITRCYTAHLIEKTGGVIELNNIQYSECVDSNLVIGGTAGFIKANDLEFNGLSGNGTVALITDANGDSFEGISFNGSNPVAIQCDGNGNYFHGRIINAVKDYENNGTGNTFIFVNRSADEIFSGNKTITTTGNAAVTANGATINTTGTTTVNSRDLVLNPTNPLTYKTPIDITNQYSYVPFKDSTGSQYKVLTFTGDHLNFSSYANVKDYGAKGDGVTNDTQAFVNCIAENESIFIPIGTYVVDSFVIPRQKYIIGENNSKSILQLNGPLKIGDGSALVNYTVVENIFLNNEANTTTALEMDTCQNTKVRDIIISNGLNTGATGVDLIKKVYTSSISATVYYGGVAAHVGGQSNGDDFIDFNAYYPTKGVVVDNSNNIRLIGSTIQSYSVCGVELNAGSVSNAVIANYFEADSSKGTLLAGVIDNSGVTNFILANRFSLLAQAGKRFVEIGTDSKPYVLGADTQSYTNYNSTFQQTKYISFPRTNLPNAALDNNGVLAGVSESGVGTRLYYSKLRGGTYMWGEVVVSNSDGSMDLVTLSGASNQRPEGAHQGEQYMDMTLGKPIWYNAGKWIDATGAEV